MSKKVFTVNDVINIRKIADDLLSHKYTTLKDYALFEYQDDKTELKNEYRLANIHEPMDEVAHAWTNAVVLFLKVKGYKIEKDEN